MDSCYSKVTHAKMNAICKNRIVNIFTMNILATNKMQAVKIELSKFALPIFSGKGKEKMIQMFFLLFLYLFLT